MCNLSNKATGNRIDDMDQTIEGNPLHRALSIPFLFAIQFYRLLSPVKQIILVPMQDVGSIPHAQSTL